MEIKLQSNLYSLKENSSSLLLTCGNYIISFINTVKRKKFLSLENPVMTGLGCVDNIITYEAQRIEYTILTLYLCRSFFAHVTNFIKLLIGEHNCPDTISFSAPLFLSCLASSKPCLSLPFWFTHVTKHLDKLPDGLWIKKWLHEFFIMILLPVFWWMLELHCQNYTALPLETVIAVIICFWFTKFKKNFISCLNNILSFLFLTYFYSYFYFISLGNLCNTFNTAALSFKFKGYIL